LMQDPKLTIKDLLKNNWKASNTNNVTPSFSTGLWDENNKYPQITITAEDENLIIPGDTGYNGLGPNALQNVEGFVDVNCWAVREEKESEDFNNGANPKGLTFQFSGLRPHI